MWYSLLSYFTLGRVYPRDRLRYEQPRAHAKQTLYINSAPVFAGVSSSSTDAIAFTWVVGDAINFDFTVGDATEFTRTIPDTIDF